jgi:hypothetical protein
VLLLPNDDGKPSGNAIVAFSSVEEASAALSLHKRKLRQVNLRPTVSLDGCLLCAPFSTPG